MWEREEQFLLNLEKCVQQKASTGKLERIATLAIEDEKQVSVGA